MPGEVLHMTLSEPSPRGICEVCGAQARTPTAKRCDEHVGQKKASRTAGIDEAIRQNSPPEPDIKRVNPPSPGASSDKDERKAQRARELMRQIQEEVNPGLAQGLAFICQPVPAINFYKEEGDKVVPNHFGEAVAFNGMETWVLAHAAAELEQSPFVGTAKAVAGPVVPIALAIGAAFLLGTKGYRVWNMREAIMTNYRNEQGMQSPGAQAEASATEAAQAAEAERAAQAPTVQNTAGAETARRAEEVQRETEAQPGNSTRAETIDVDLGVAHPAAVDLEELPNVLAESDAELADLLSR